MLPITLYDVAAQFQPTAGGNAYTPTTYNRNPQPLFVTITSGAQISATITSGNYSTYTADKGLVTANYSNSENPAVNNVQIGNYGSVGLINQQFATGRVSLFNSDSQVNSSTINNNSGGSISVTQTAFTAAPATPGSPSTFSKSNLSITSSGSPATFAAKYNGSTLNITTAFYSDDNTNEFTVKNAANASILATGNYTSAYYGRADTTITNSGTIANTTWVPSDTISAGHWAIAAYAGTNYTTAANTNPDSSTVIPNADGSVSIGDTSSLTLTNKGTIKGDVLALDITPLVYAAAVGSSTNPFPNPGQTTLLQLPVSSGNAGPRDSDIANKGTIQGNVYLGSGTHVVHNEAGATLQGSVTVDQRPFQASFAEPTPGTAAGTYASKGGVDFNGNTCPSAGQNTTNPGCATTTNHIATVVGGQSLTLTNKGTFTGDIRIFDEATSKNSITLDGTGFSGNVVAVNGTGDNSLTLNNVTTLASVQNFRSIDLKRSNVAVGGGVSLVTGAGLGTTIYGAGGTRAAPSTNLGTIAGTLTLSGATTLTPTYKSLVRDGDVYQVASAVTGPGAAQVTVKNSSALVKASTDATDGRLLLVTDVRNANTVSGLNQPGAATLNGLTTYDGTNSQVLASGGLVESLKTDADVRAAASSLSPIVNGADIQTVINSTLLFDQQIDSRLDSFIYGQIPSSGRSADLGVARPTPVYGALPTNGAWIEGIGGGVHQSTAVGTPGYTAEIEGVIGGYDRLIGQGLRVGGAFGYIDGRVNGQSAIGAREDIQTYQGLAYATWEQPSYYLRGSVGYGGVNFQSSRQVTFAGFNDVATGSHDGNVLTARGEAGVPFEYRGNLLVPYAAFTYGKLEQSAYTESSANGAALAYGSASNDSDRSEIGGKIVVPLGSAPVFSYLFPAGSSVVALEGRAVYVHEFGKVAQTVSASFVGGGSAFVATGPTPNRDMVDYGLGLRMGSGAVQFDVSYNGLARSSYLQQVGVLRARYVF
jgi:uncharacterized protein with beta-barrel porin domain